MHMQGYSRIMKKFIATDQPHGEFIVPYLIDNEIKLTGLKTKKYYDAALVVYVGKEITENDVFAKLVDAGFIFSSVDRQLEVLRESLDVIKTTKIGSMLEIRENKLRIKGTS